MSEFLVSGQSLTFRILGLESFFFGALALGDSECKILDA